MNSRPLESGWQSVTSPPSGARDDDLFIVYWPSDPWVTMLNFDDDKGQWFDLSEDDWVPWEDVEGAYWTRPLQPTEPPS